jgi:hypothetical protein
MNSGAAAQIATQTAEIRAVETVNNKAASRLKRDRIDIM